jgi:hypothetical protein
MMTDTDKLSQRIRKRFDHNQAKRILREKYQTKMLFAYSGGMWCADPALITQCNLCIANNHQQPVLLDTHDNPVQVDAEELKTLALERWQEQMNAWHAEYEALKRER